MIQKDNLVQRLINKSQECTSEFAADLNELRCLMEESADELMHQQNETLRWKAECLGVWPAPVEGYKALALKYADLQSELEGYKELAKQNNYLAEEVATLREQLAEASKKLEDYRDLDSLLCK